MRIRHLLALVLLLIWQAACHVPRRTPGNIEFTILQINDVYEIAPLEGGKAGGLARVATVKKQLLAENPNTIAVISGDFLSPSFFGTLKDDSGQLIAGRQMVETLNVMGMDYATFGNHEFDLRTAELVEERIHQSDFRYVSCNARRRSETGLLRFTEEVGGKVQPIQDYLIHEFADPDGGRVKVGILGVVLPFNQTDYVAYLPVEESFREAYRKMQPEVDVAVALTHLSEEEDMELARAVPGIPLFMGGHDHHHMSHYVGSTIITKADANAKTVYIHRVTYNPQAGMVRIRSTLKVIDDSIPEDPATQAVVGRWQNRTNRIMVDMGYQPQRILMVARQPLESTEYKIRTQPTNYGRLVAQSFRYVWPEADVYLLNGGSMRVDDDLTGTITEYDVLRTLPFGGGIVRMELSGSVLARTLETGLRTNQGQGGYFQLIQVAEEKGEWLIQGRPLDPAATYSVVLPEFVAKGRESNLTFLGDYEYEKRESFEVKGDTVDNDVRDILIAYMDDEL